MNPLKPDGEEEILRGEYKKEKTKNEQNNVLINEQTKSVGSSVNMMTT